MLIHKIYTLFLLVLVICSCENERENLFSRTSLLKHEINNLDSISYYISQGYNGVEFDLHISDTSLLVYYDDPQKANLFADYLNFMKRNPNNLFWIDLKTFTKGGLVSFCRTMPAMSNCFIETNVEEVVDFLSVKGYNLIYTIRHVSDWNESDSLCLKQEIDHAIQKDWLCVPENTNNILVTKQILGDPSVTVLLLDYKNVYYLKNEKNN